MALGWSERSALGRPHRQETHPLIVEEIVGR